jgi:SnoaL-like domain
VTPADVLVDLVHAIDALDWAGVRAVLADELTTDYTSLFGGSPVEQTGDELVAQWQALLPGFTATQHLLGPVRVSGSSARAHVRAAHCVDGARWIVAGHYRATLTGDGRISALVLDTYYQDGDRDLPATAQQRIEAGRVRTGPATT